MANAERRKRRGGPRRSCSSPDRRLCRPHDRRRVNRSRDADRSTICRPDGAARWPRREVRRREAGRGDRPSPCITACDAGVGRSWRTTPRRPPWARALGSESDEHGGRTAPARADVRADVASGGESVARPSGSPRRTEEARPSGARCGRDGGNERGARVRPRRTAVVNAVSTTNSATWKAMRTRQANMLWCAARACECVSSPIMCMIGWPMTIVPARHRMDVTPPAHAARTTPAATTRRARAHTWSVAIVDVRVAMVASATDTVARVATACHRESRSPDTVSPLCGDSPTLRKVDP